MAAELFNLIFNRRAFRQERLFMDENNRVNYFDLFDLIIYVPSTIVQLSVIKGRISLD